ncbi:hypothetical protein Tco_0462869 [Tanacetum coccineum]
MVVNEEWLAGNDEYIERKVLKEMKLKRKREEKKSPGRWTRGDEAKDLAEKHKKIKKNSNKIQKVQEKMRIKEKKKKVKVKGSEKNKRINKQKHNSVLKGRATVRQLFEAMRGLSPERKKVIREMGFRDLIEFPIFEIPTKLAFYVIDILNTKNMTLECPMGDIEITLKTWTANGEKETGKRRPQRVQ